MLLDLRILTVVTAIMRWTAPALVQTIVQIMGMLSLRRHALLRAHGDLCTVSVLIFVPIVRSDSVI